MKSRITIECSERVFNEVMDYLNENSLIDIVKKIKNPLDWSLDGMSIGFCIASGRKLEAIRIYRRVSGLSLSDSKDEVDKLFNNQTIRKTI